MDDQNQSSAPLTVDIETISQELHLRPEILKRIIASFAQTLSDKTQSLSEALSGNDILKARAILHELRGTSGNLRLNQIYDAARILHEAVKADEEKEKLNRYFEVLKSYSGQLTECVKA